MEQEKRVTIKELSKLMGVSTTTITNALTGQPNVSEKRRKEIIEKAKELGYKPNQYARAMVRNGFKIGVITADEPHEFLDYLKKGLKEGFKELADYKVQGIFETYSNHNANEEFKDALLKVISEGVNGLILGTSFDISGYSDILKDLYENKNMPIVLLHRDVNGDCFSGILIPGSKVIGEMVAEFIAMTHPRGTKVAAITTKKEFTPHRDAVEAFKENCRRHGLKICDIYENNDSKQETYHLTQRILTDHPDCKVIYVTSFNSVSACRCIRNMNLDKKVSVIAHDIYPEMVKYMQDGVLLAAIYQNPILMGRLAVNIAFNHIAGDKSEGGRIIIRPELILRSNMSCFPELKEETTDSL